MRKNKMMRLASVLLVLCLLTTSVISGTFAKYITTDQYEDTARVAKFGVVATVSGDMFGATYTAADENAITTYSTNGGTVSSSGAEDFVVAPGTENKEGLNLFITGTPEVSTKVHFDAAEDKDGADYVDCDIYLGAGTYGIMVEYTGVLTEDNVGNYYYDDEGVYRKATAKQIGKKDVYELHDVVEVSEKYYPLIWYVNGEKVADQAAVKTELASIFNNKEFKPNKSNALEATVGWEWLFGDKWNDEKDNKELTTDVDMMDTVLGNMMVLKDTSADLRVVKMSGDTYSVVKVVEVNVKGNSANTKYVATVNGQEVACLTVAFNARLTVEQVD